MPSRLIPELEAYEDYDGEDEESVEEFDDAVSDLPDVPLVSRTNRPGTYESALEREPTDPEANFPPPSKVWVNRIVKYAIVDPESLLANPKNWRIHPEHQKQAMTEVLDYAGWANGITVNINTGTVVDGHMRAALCLKYNVHEIPVCYSDLTDEIETFLLGVYDQIQKEAVPDYDKLASLQEEILAKLPPYAASLSRLIQNSQERNTSLASLREAREALMAENGGSDRDDDPGLKRNMLWKFIKVKVTDATYDRYNDLFEQMPGDSEDAKMYAFITMAEIGFNSADNTPEYEPQEVPF